MGAKIALGTPVTNGSCVEATPESIEEQLNVLIKRVDDITRMLNSINSIRSAEPEEDYPNDETNSDKIPIGTPLIGTSTRGGTVVLNVNADGYYVNGIKYDSLSAAAEAVSGVRRSGWTFWKTFDGRTAKEVFGR